MLSEFFDRLHELAYVSGITLQQMKNEPVGLTGTDARKLSKISGKMFDRVHESVNSEQ